MEDENCNTAWNAWLTNVTYAIFRNNSKGSNVFLQSDVPLLERDVRGRGADLSGERTRGAMTRDVEMGLEHESDDETGSAASPIGQSKKKKTRRRRKSKGKNSTKGKKKKGKRKQTKRGRKKK